MKKMVAGSSPPGSNKHTNRESWLMAAFQLLCLLFTEHGHELAAKIRMGVGFPRAGRHGKHKVDVFPAEKSKGGYIEIFFRPDLEDELEILTLFVSALILSMTPDGPEHSLQYKARAAEIGLRGTKREPHCAPALRDRLNSLISDLGPIPHNMLDIGTPIGAAPKQTTRMLLAQCPKCNGRNRLTQETIDKSGLPLCGTHRVQFTLVTKVPSKTTTPASSLPLETTLTHIEPKTRPAHPPLTETAATPTGRNPDVDHLDDDPSATVDTTSLRPALTWTVRFDDKPNDAVRAALLKKFGGRWVVSKSHWCGVGNTDDVRTLAEQSGGVFELAEDGGAS